MVDRSDFSDIFPPDEDDGDSFAMDEFEVEYSLDQLPEVDVAAACQKFFAPDGILAGENRINGQPCETRPQQGAMAQLPAAVRLKYRATACSAVPADCAGRGG